MPTRPCARCSTSWTAPFGVPVRPPLARPARRQPPGGRPAGRGRFPLPPRRLPHGARPRRERDRAPEHPGGGALPLGCEGGGAASARAPGDPAITLAAYLEATGLELDDVYAANHSWSDLRADAGFPSGAPGPHEPALRRACGRLLHVDDAARIEAYRYLLSTAQPPQGESLAARDRRFLRMLVGSIADQVVDRQPASTRGRHSSGTTRWFGRRCSSCWTCSRAYWSMSHSPC